MLLYTNIKKGKANQTAQCHLGVDKIGMVDKEKTSFEKQATKSNDYAQCEEIQSDVHKTNFCINTIEQQQF